MTAAPPVSIRRLLPQMLVAWGPGLLVMLADTDAGNVVAAAQAGAQFGYRLLPLILALAPALYLVQELAARLGLFTGRGFGQLTRESFGKFWAFVAFGGLVVGALGTLVTEFTGVAGVGELYGVSPDITLPPACLVLLAATASESHRRVERIALALGLFECAFLYVAWRAAPDLSVLARQTLDAPFGDRGFLILAAAMVGASFSPWMIFFQQAATARKGLRPNYMRALRWDTASGAILSQALTGAVLVATASLNGGAGGVSLGGIGEAGAALSAAFGAGAGRLMFSLGVMGASLAAAVVTSLAVSQGVAEIFGRPERPHRGLFHSPLSFTLFALCMAGAANLVRRSDDLIWLNLAAQVVNALLFPLLVGLLILLATRLPQGQRLDGGRLWLTGSVAAATAAIGLFGAFGLIAR